MKFLFDLLPVVLFFVAYYIPADRAQGIYLATAVAIVTSLLQVGFYRIRHGKYEKMQLATLGLIVVLGGATLLLHDKRFIMWKPTAVNWVFGLTFLGSQFIGEKNLVRRMMEHAISLPSAIWIRLNLSWALFFFALGLANLYVAFNFAEDIWVKFKLFGMMGLTLIFVVGQSIYLARHAQEPEEKKG